MTHKPKTNVSLSSWQIAQLERMTENFLNQLRRDGLSQHALTRSVEELLKTLNEASVDDTSRREAPQQTIWIVMGNDFPDAAFSQESDAEAYCQQMRQKDIDRGMKGRIYWRTYSFSLQQRSPSAHD